MLVWGSLSLTPTNLMVYHPHWGAPYPPDLILHGEQRQLYMLMSLSLSAIVVLAVSLSQRQNGKYCDASKEELRDWHEMEAKTECVNAATTL